ncbi:predicted protein [Uncinocarpus reesii 1704]|uniref:Uncharacterized protein n=1 Tax=Uncinocarpus reesii (strain UAMH 1704) TaxID=336963 RepID=C4JE91_UNCRE|nr:uncharacterized protein UREG_00532 [Uncinocarpus reesii 1704]EEP75686.1 predicted protein [Uncinocarpus reesii 1704]
MPGHNPFRRKKAASDTPAPPAHASSDVAEQVPGSTIAAAPAAPSDNDPPPTQSSRTKTVRIASPPTLIPPVQPLTPLSGKNITPFQRISMHRGSPPPPMPDSDPESPADEGSLPLDPFDSPEISGSDDYERRQLEDDILRSSPLHTNEEAGIGRYGRQDQGGLGRPISSGGTGFASRALDNAPPTPEQRKRAKMDVDAFARMLLRGSSESSLDGTQPGSQPQDRTAPGGGSNANAHGAEKAILQTASTPRQDIPDGPSKSDRGDENPQVERKPTERKKPPPPKTRHGKPIQTDPDMASIGASTPSPASDKYTSPFNRISLSSPSYNGGRVVSDPPIPSRSSDGSARASIQERRFESRSEPFSKPLTLPKRPPTPPARRNSQLKTHRSSPPVTRSSSTRLPTNTNSPLHMSSIPRTPPPPPSRRRDRESSTSSPSTQSRLSITPDTIAPLNGGADDASENTSLQRSESGSVRSVNRASRLSGSSAVPPRPPPPRRSGGSYAHGSDDSRAARPRSLGSDESGHRFEEKETEEPPAPPRSNAGNILETLSKLQQEVDELRGRYERKPPN